MRSGGAVIVIIVALLIMYAAITGRYKCFGFYWRCVTEGPEQCNCGNPAGGTEPSPGAVGAPDVINYPLPRLPGLPPIKSVQL